MKLTKEDFAHLMLVWWQGYQQQQDHEVKLHEERRLNFILTILISLLIGLIIGVFWL